MPDSPNFIFVICQNGAEKAARGEIVANHPSLSLAFSRPGFITFKLADGKKLPENFTLKSTLARTWGWSLGKCVGESAEELVAQITGVDTLASCKHLHVWQRDHVLPGKNGFEPGVSTLAASVSDLFAAKLSASLDGISEPSNAGKKASHLFNRIAQPDDRVFDVVMVEPNEWWYGYHVASHVAGRWPGGSPLIDTSVETCSRAYFKLKEALLWSGIKIQPEDVCAEIGSAPGGACQLMLEMGAVVIGVDPAEMEKEILEHENFMHIRKRSSEVRKKDFAQVKWLVSDMSVTPTYTLDAIEEIVSHELVNVTGLVMTMKLTDWKLIEDVPAAMARVKKLGFKFVRARQLAFNRQEFCLVALTDRFALRKGKNTRKGKSKNRRKPASPKPDGSASATKPAQSNPTANELE